MTSDGFPHPPLPAGALEGLRVVDLSMNLAGPYCGQILADLGARVVKVERPGTGDPARSWAPPSWDGEGTLFLAANRGKRSLALDLAGSEGREILHRLLEGADVAIQAFRPEVTRRFGLTEDELRRDHPSLILCSITGFPHDGSLAERPGYDPLLQAWAGLMSVTGTPEGPPVRVGTSLVDMGAGLWAALGVMAALRARDAVGPGNPGSHVRVSLMDTATAWGAYHLAGTLATGEVPGRSASGIGMIAPYGAFPTSDGGLMIAAANDGLFRSLCRALDLPDLEGDPRFASNPRRVDHREELQARLASRTRTFSRENLEARLLEAGVPCAPIRDMEEVSRDPEVLRSSLRPEPHPRIPGYRGVAPPPSWDGIRTPPLRHPPAVGEHTDEILEELGLSPKEIRRLREEGVVG